jgi:MAP/microtubule affinity-regulating kinase
VSAVGYLHEHNIAHRDLKLDNVLLDMSTNAIKLIDFGFSTRVVKDQPQKMFCGTPNYMAPEITQKKEYSGMKTDVWALGVLLFVLCTGHFPFKSYTNDAELFRKI